MSSFGILVFILLTTQNTVMGKSDPQHHWWSMEKLTKTLIKDAGCPFVSKDQLLVRNVCLMPYYRPNESPQVSNFIHYVDVNLLKADVLKVDEDNYRKKNFLNENERSNGNVIQTRNKG